MQTIGNRLARTLYTRLPLLPRWPGVILVLLSILALAWLVALTGYYAAVPTPPRGDGLYLFRTLSWDALRIVVTDEQPAAGNGHGLHTAADVLAWCALAWLLLIGTFVSLRRPLTAWLAASTRNHVLVWGSGSAALEASLAARASRTPGLALLPRRDVTVQDSLDHYLIPWQSAARSDAVLDRTLACPGSTILATDDSDTANIGLMERVSKRLATGQPAPGVSLIVRISDGRLRGQISKRLLGRRELRKLRLVLYSDHDLRARFAARMAPAFQFCHALQPDLAHLIVVGRGYPAESMLVQILKTMHFARGKRLRVSVVNEIAPMFEADFQARFPELVRHYPIGFQQLDISSDADWAGWLLNHVQAGRRPTGWYFVDDDSAAGLKHALAVEEAYSMIGEVVPPLVLLSAGEGEAGASPLIDVPMLKAVGDVTRVEDGDLVSQKRMDAMATAIQQSYLDKCFAAGEQPGSRPTLHDWPQLAELFKDENRDQAEHNLVKLLLLGLSPANEGGGPVRITLPELEILSVAEHDRWLASRRSRNWVYADERDDERRYHPDMISWEELPEPRREIDRDMVRNLPRLVERMGLSLKKRIYCLVTEAAPMDEATESVALQRIRELLDGEYMERKAVVVGDPAEPLVKALFERLPDAEYLAVIATPPGHPDLLRHARTVLAGVESPRAESLARMLPDLSQDWLVIRLGPGGELGFEQLAFSPHAAGVA